MINIYLVDSILFTVITILLLLSLFKSNLKIFGKSSKLLTRFIAVVFFGMIALGFWLEYFEIIE